MSRFTSSILLGRVDRIGAAVSLACAIHCMATPLIIIVLSLVGISTEVHDSLHALLVFGSVALAAGSLCWGFRVHRDWRLFMVLGGAVALIIRAQFRTEGIQETGLMVAGAGLLVIAHLLNRRLCGTCAHCEHASEGTEQ
jgi:hypothetical protein